MDVETREMGLVVLEQAGIPAGQVMRGEQVDALMLFQVLERLTAHLEISSEERLPEADKLREWERAYRDWLASFESERTRRAYEAAWEDFSRFVLVKPWLVEPGDVREWIEDMKTRSWQNPRTRRADGSYGQEGVGLSANTINQRHAAVSSFYSYVMERHWVTYADGSQRPLHDKNPAKGVRRVRVRSFARATYLDGQQVRALLAAIPKDTARGLQAYALLACYLFTGRRNRVIRCLRKGDFRMVAGKVQYHWENKGKERWDEMPPPAWWLIQVYLKKAGRAFETLRDEEYIFTALSDRAARLPGVEAAENRPLSGREVGRILKRYARAAGLDAAGIHVHTLRHTTAEALRSAGADIHEASRFLAHSSTAVTELYFDHLEGQENAWWMQMAAAWQVHWGEGEWRMEDGE